MILRKYIPSDCEQLAKLFYQTVHSVNAKDYTKEQLDVWATGNVNLQEWDKSFTEHYTVVAIENNIIVGFGDIDVSGYLDRLFVHREHQREGIASAICDELEQSASVKTITTHSSITAKPFFEHRGYRVIQKQTVIRNGIALTNFIRPGGKFCVSVFRQNQEYHIIHVHDWGLFPLATAFPGGWDGMRDGTA